MKKRGQILAVLLTAALLAGCSPQEKEQGGNAQPATGQEKTVTQEPESEPEKESGTQETENKKDSKETYEIVSNGVLYEIPKSYEVSLDEEAGNIYIDDGDLEFSLVMVVRDGSYEESLEDKDALTANARQQDVTILQDITEYTSDGKSYAYFTFQYNGEEESNTVIYTKATDDKRVGMNMVINGDMTQEEVIDRINVFMKTAQATDREDTTRDQLYEQAGLGGEVTTEPEGVALDQTEMTLDDTSITVSVPDGFLYQEDLDAVADEMFSKKYFYSADSNAELSLYAEGMYTDLKEMIESECVINDNAKKVEKEGPKTETCNGMQVVYKCVSYVYDNTEFHKAMAGVQLPDHSVYAVMLENLDGEKLTFDSLQPFLDVKAR